MNSKLTHQLTDTLLMIQPVQFGFNEETSKTNSFQNEPARNEAHSIQEKALIEFKQFVTQLEQLGVTVLVFEDTLDSFTPDSIFPNNWISTHQNGDLFTYPMTVPNRRKERNLRIIDFLTDKFHFTHIDLSGWENELPPRYLEGTGSMIFDRPNRICYAALSSRTHLAALKEFGSISNFEIVAFHALGKNGEAIYHTNVMLSVGETFVCVGAETISEEDRSRVVKSFESSGKEIIEFTNEQIYSHFAGNMLQVKNAKGESVLVLSDRIFGKLTTHQRARLAHHNDHLLPIDIRTVEKIGGGSVRCMLAEIFNPTHRNAKRKRSRFL